MFDESKFNSHRRKVNQVGLSFSATLFIIDPSPHLIRIRDKSTKNKLSRLIYCLIKAYLLGPTWIPAPISSMDGELSMTVTSCPAWPSAYAVARPPMPQPTYLEQSGHGYESKKLGYHDDLQLFFRGSAIV